MRIRYDNSIKDKLKDGIKISRDAFTIGEKAILSALLEVSTSPSPGLVSPFSSGAHSDMNFTTFLRSTAAISSTMSICAQIGMDYDEDLLPKIRVAGLIGEENMFKATGGVNTQRGIIFLLGIISAAAGRCLALNIDVNRENISTWCKKIGANLVEEELKQLKINEKKSKGEELFIRYGVTGIRGEVENGIPTIILGLKYLEEALNFGLTFNESLTHALIGIMTSVEDTTVMSRLDMDGYYFMKEISSKAMALGGMKTEEGRAFIEKMDSIFIEKNISPGGAADLLAGTVMVHELEKEFKTALKHQ